MSGKCRPSLRAKTLCNVWCSNLSQTDKDCIHNVFELVVNQKAEIERLKEALTDHEYANCVAVKNGLIYTYTLADYDNLIKDISAEAVKEFADRLKPILCNYYDDVIDNLVKEMVDNNG